MKISSLMVSSDTKFDTQIIYKFNRSLSWAFGKYYVMANNRGIYFGDNEEKAVEALIDSSKDDERIRNYELPSEEK